MNKKVLALAVASVVAAPAAVAQTSNVQLYGRANLGFDHYQAKGARNQGALTGSQINYNGRFRIFDSGSRVGLRGTEDLGNGLKAIFQIETGVNVDNGSNTGQGGQANASSGFWASRDSFVGLDSNWGRITLGRQSIYWANGVNAQFAANYINTEIPWTNGTGFGRVGVPSARTSNTVAYTTPTFGGINGTLSYSTCAAGTTGTTTNFCQEAVQHNNTVDTNGRVWGATVRGTFGPFYGQVDYIDGKGNSNLTALAPGAAVIKANAWKAGASWGYMPGARVGVIWARVERNNAVGLQGDDRVHIDGWTINWEHTFGNFQAMAQYGWTSDLKRCDELTAAVSCADSDSQGYMIGGRYLLSKRTWLYASYNRVSNGRNTFSDYTGGAITSVGSPTVVPYGADPQIWALGLFHQF